MKKILFDYNKLRKDVEKANRKFEDGKSISARLNEYGLGDYVLGNSRETFSRNFGAGKVNIEEYEHCEQYGLLAPFRFKGLCDCFGLNADDYKVNKREKNEACAVDKTYNQQEEVNACSCDNQKVIDKLDELITTINKLGNIQMQNMEYLKSIKDGIQTMNDKYNKPSAYIRR